MSLDTRNITQGGQVIKYMIGMFIQITNIVVYWSLLPALGSFFIYLFSVMKWVHIKHGAVYWLLFIKAKFCQKHKQTNSIIFRGKQHKEKWLSLHAPAHKF